MAKKRFGTGDMVVYPAHGVGKIEAVEAQEIAGMPLELYVIRFDDDRMTLKVPVIKAEKAGMRALSTMVEMTTALDTLKGRARVRRAMWSRRAQEYEAKINSGDPTSIAEVVRDLHRTGDQAEQSYSERQMYQLALDRLAREYAAVEQLDLKTAAIKLETLLDAAA
ncbi:MAG: CarD family transcriptional regulator [Tistrella sp.]|jgi:CarD family transcriptional regulator|uniref:Transcription factor CarD-like protein n=2 Tax=Tistrella mobilis TaxID=171437 RepID=I3TQ54_TISMK|nr:MULTISPECIES: CarD family transcriptional regulator [Tistrella]AFK54892.1 Transcription factor CarD-like protein [Tistrella mobilis KA081020-065]KYO54374.1 CarD family transcriptional regulator [Tistrella mobilis]MAD38137.1 CarD family transcriptional regulator [Tistrella sp.]MAM77015.1 CarD family transcriptional regulator [Tistrella sp.]MBA75467.1 CarD family transcriptional regulator [Tistrella sp.]|tara:strand:- start:288 stop:785 length:498 start_codon:yes stop_codon:yes gene_type:complete